MMTRTGIYGGSFNPIHNGHIALASQLADKAGLDEIWFVVSPQNPLKQQSSLLDDGLRLDMVRRALAPYPQLHASDCEFALPRPSYMWHTLRHLSSRYADREFTLIIGGDNWAVFDRWYHAADIISHYPIVIYPRRGSAVDAASLPHGVRLVDTPLYDISSTDVRQAVAEGRDISRMVPECIAADVRRLYATGSARQG